MLSLDKEGGTIAACSAFGRTAADAIAVAAVAFKVTVLERPLPGALFLHT